ncbi:unnamed protein product [Danaus chrysippus]|uniref:(African queen) hypothetical protein n=1 Tax=Danaus chrysippus TaxID=151541 RepID=A0A8J2MWP6_9NEOP|nr:unnamed protein product [Danaus chrysippus]
MLDFGNVPDSASIYIDDRVRKVRDQDELQPQPASMDFQEAPRGGADLTKRRYEPRWRQQLHVQASNAQPLAIYAMQTSINTSVARGTEEFASSWGASDRAAGWVQHTNNPQDLLRQESSL